MISKMYIFFKKSQRITPWI